MTPPSKLKTDLICFSHLRWNFVYQRPQHLMSRFAKNGTVYFIEEPVLEGTASYYNVRKDSKTGVHVITPYLSADTPDIDNEQRKLLNGLILSLNIDILNTILWYYTPMALAFSNHLKPAITVYDCMDELSLFRFAPKVITQWENQLLSKASVVFTGGMRLFEAKKHLHPNIHPFPSGIDIEHFTKCRHLKEEPADQHTIPHPRIGFYGVLDERINFELLQAVAMQKPDWHFVMIGPIVKIDPRELPGNSNIHFLGMKDYNELPGYLAGWEVAMMPFSLNDATKYISPTKTPEFLAAGKRVVSTSIHDVIFPYEAKGFVTIADTPSEFVSSIEQILNNLTNTSWMDKADSFLSERTWDVIWKQMNNLLNKSLLIYKLSEQQKTQEYV